jgi:RNA polymerase sigma-70 factor (ECF subfamily)
MSPDSPTKPEDWVALHGDVLFRFAITRVKDPGVAEDLVQETFLAALKGRESFSGKSSERTWLVGILKHKISDHFRNASREQPVEDPQVYIDPEDPFDESGRWKVGPGKWGGSPAKAMEDKEFWGVFGRCLEDLPERLRQVFSLRELDGVEGSQVCKVLSISSTNLWVILHRARTQLRKCLELNWFGDKKE